MYLWELFTRLKKSLKGSESVMSRKFESRTNTILKPTKTELIGRIISLTGIHRYIKEDCGGSCGNKTRKDGKTDINDQLQIERIDKIYYLINVYSFFL